MLLIIDNYDSFTFNIEQYFKKLAVEVEVRKNDQISIREMEELNLSHIVISPGPHAPNDAGISLEVIDHFKGQIPILGICLGHQAIGQYFGAEVVKAKQPKHGRQSLIHHNEKTIFAGIPNPYTVTRYHSLVIDPQTIPPELEVTSTADDGEVMSIRHKHYPIEGVQFHPESILTEFGYKLLQNFIKHY